MLADLGAANIVPSIVLNNNLLNHQLIRQVIRPAWLFTKMWTYCNAINILEFKKKNPVTKMYIHLKVAIW